MSKKNIPKKNKPIDDIMLSSESIPVYRPLRIVPTIANFPSRKFEKIAAQVPFTQREWAAILHLSEKTLQRYAKDNKSFEGIYVDRILQMQELIAMGLETFTSPDAFYRWLKRDKQVLGERISFESLTNSYGIKLVIDQLGRIQHGVYI